MVILVLVQCIMSACILALLVMSYRLHKRLNNHQRMNFDLINRYNENHQAKLDILVERTVPNASPRPTLGPIRRRAMS